MSMYSLQEDGIEEYEQVRLVVRVKAKIIQVQIVRQEVLLGTNGDCRYRNMYDECM